jgi:hypothetical protein
MARIHRTLRVAVLLLGSCSAPGAGRDAADPLEPRDLEPFPAAVAADNARDVVRKALQAHRRSASDVHRRTGYVFRDRGFVQLVRDRASSGGAESETRIFADYASLSSTASRVVLDTALLRERIEVTLVGRFRAWSARVTPYEPLPDLGAETGVRDRSSMVLVFDDAEAARKLQEALRLLSGR